MTKCMLMWASQQAIVVHVNTSAGFISNFSCACSHSAGGLNEKGVTTELDT